MRRFCSAAVLVLVLVFAVEARTAGAVSAAGRPGDAVASVGAMTVTREALQERLWSSDARHLLIMKPFPKVREEILEEMIRERLLAQEAKGGGIRKDPDFIAVAEIAVDGWLAKNYLKSVLGPAVVPTPEDLAPYLPKSFERIRVRHIAVPTEEEARDARARLVAGADFEALARDLTIAPGGAERGGELGWVSRGASDIYPNEVMEGLFDLRVREPSAVVKTPLGYEIFRVEERAALSPEEIEQYMGTPRLLAGTEKRNRLIERLRRERGVTVDEKAAAAFAAAPEIDEGTVLGEAGGWRLTAGGFRAWRASFKNPAQRPSIRTGEQVGSAVLGLLTQKAMRLELEARGFLEDLEHRRTLEKYYQSASVTFLYDRAVAGARMDDGIFKDFLAKNSARIPDVQKLRPKVIVTEDEASIRRIQEQLRAGTAWDLLARAYSTDASSAKGGDLGDLFLHQIDPAYRERVVTIPVKVATEPFEVNGRWIILKVEEREKPRKATDAEARDLLWEEARLEEERRHLDQYFAGLRKVYPVKINAAVRDAIPPPPRSGIPPKKD